jgi:RNA polymerase sigma-70 factor (ECF subfamily)
MEAATPDEALAQRAATGDRAAFEALLRRHYDRIFRLAWRMTGSRQDAEDVAQDVCCALVDRISSFRGEARFTTWLTGVTINACRDRGRRSSTFARLKDAFGVWTANAQQPDGRSLFERSVLTDGLKRLEAGLLDAVILVAGEGLSHAEAARVLGVKESTVSWRMHEARKKLGRLLEEDVHG